MSERFGDLGTMVERMERTLLDEPARLAFAAEALALRFPKDRPGTVTPSDILKPRRPEDDGNDLWRTYNTVQLWGAPHNCTYVHEALMCTELWAGGL